MIDEGTNGRPSPFAGRFAVRRQLGAGGMGVVYEAYDSVRGSLVALKMMKTVDAAALYRFKREFRALSDIHHPNLITLYELLSIGDEWFFTMELIDGVSFTEFVRPGTARDDVTQTVGPPADLAPATARTGGTGDTVETSPRDPIDEPEDAPPPASLDLARLRAAVRQLAEGIFALHDAGRLHRDIKPSNVLVTHQGRVVLCDFGLVREISPPALDETRRDAAIGTVAYMSPEQAANRSLTQASDWYSFGVLLYEALTGQLPFAGDRRDVLVRKQTEPAPPVASARGDAPDDLASLCDRLLRQSPAERPGGDEVLRRLGATSTPALTGHSAQSVPFVGRQRELEALRAAYDAMRAGATTVAFISGTSGVGKSALMHQLCVELRERHDALVLTGRCYERESVPYKAFDSLVDALSNYLIRLPRAEADALIPAEVTALSRLFPVLRRVPSIAEPRVLGVEARDPLENRSRAFGALREVIARIARRRPLVLSIDDLQWGDLDSGSLLLELLRPPDAPPVLVVATYRREERPTSGLLADLLDSEQGAAVLAGHLDLELSPLDAGTAAQLAKALLAGDGGRADIARAIAAESGGSPFFVGELVRYVHAGGDTVGEINLDAVLGARLAQLSHDARNLLSVVAVAAHPVAVDIAVRAARVTGDHGKALATLQVDHLVRALGSRAQDAIEVYHDRVREAVSRSLAPDELRRIHGELARAYEASEHPDAEVLLEHWFGAGDQSIAATYAESAATAAADALAFDRAARLYRVALDLVEHPAQGQSRLRTLLGDALVNAGRGLEAADVFLLALEGATAAEALELRRRAAEQLLQTGHIERGLAVLEQVLDEIGTHLARTPARALASLLWRRAVIRVRGLGFRERDTSQVSAEELTRLDILWSVAKALSLIDNIRGADFQSRYLRVSLNVGEPYRIARALALESAYAATGGSRGHKRAVELSEIATAYATKIGKPDVLGLNALISGVSAWLRGDFDNAQRSCAAAERIFRAQCTGMSWEVATAQMFWFGTLYFKGELTQLARTVPVRVREAEARGNLHSACILRAWYTNAAWLVTDDVDMARRQLDHAEAQWSPTGFHLQHFYFLLARVQLALYTGRADDAWERINRDFKPLQRSLLTQIQIIAAEARQMRARAALAVAATTNDARLVARAARDASWIARVDLAYARGFAHLIRAGVDAARAAGDPAARLQAAEDEFAAANMRIYAAACQYRRGQLAARARDDAGGAELTAGAARALVDMGAANPSRLVRMLAPGFGDAGSDSTPTTTNKESTP